MSKRILFLAERMAMGFGVSVVIDNLSAELVKLGHSVHVGCQSWDGQSAKGYKIHVVNGNTESVEKLVSELQSEYVVAHTTPFFEILPRLSSVCERWVWEHGDPTPELFPFDGAERRRIAEAKHISVYPNVDKVIAISEFIRDDIGWPSAEIVYNGCDHIQPEKSAARSNTSLRVGTLMRLGQGESYYKGNLLYADLVRYLRSQGADVEFHLMGRGTREDARQFEDIGVITHLNASDQERALYLADLDIFLSLSLWEGFNLPLVEAMCSGTCAIAFDTGAHPEVTPLIVSRVQEMAELINSLAKDRTHLERLAAGMESWVREKFTWAKAAEEMNGYM